MNILFIDKSKIFAGAEYSLTDLVNNLDKSRFNILICTNYPQAHHNKFSANGFSIISRNKQLKWWMGSDFSFKAPRGTDLIKRFIFAVQLALIIKKRRINVCHINLLRNTDILDIVFAKLTGCKVVGHIRSLQSQARLNSLTINLCSTVICTSEKVLSDIKMLKINTPAKRVYDSVNIKKYNTSGLDIIKLKSGYSINNTTFILSSIAILDPRKGHDTAIMTLYELSMNHNDVMLLIAGGSVNDSEPQRLKKMASELNLNDKVIFTGHLDQIIEIYAISDIILALSKDGEAFGRVPLEAAASKKVIVATNLGATPEIVTDRTTGFLVESDNHIQVANIISEVINSEGLRQHIAENAYFHAVNNFSPGIHTREIEAIYNSLS